MGEFIKSELFHQMGPIAIAFDEGLANPENVYTGTAYMNLSSVSSTSYNSTPSSLLW